MKLNIYTELDSAIENKINRFLLDNDTMFNPLFSSPLWAERLKKLLNFDYRFLIVEENDNILALLLVFKGFKGYSKTMKLPFFIRETFEFFFKNIFGYYKWYNSIVLLKDLSEENKLSICKMLFSSLDNYKLDLSPINEKESFFKNKTFEKWGTYILDIKDSNYETAYLNFKRQARKAIEKTKNDGVYVKRINNKNIEDYMYWLKDNQSLTSKNYKVSLKDMKNEFLYFDKNNYIYEIFVAYKEDKILGSLGIWGYNNFISEWGMYQSLYAKEKKLYVQDLIKDEILQYMIENKIRYYDFSGFNPNEYSTSKEKAIKQFKSKFRGTEYIYNNVKG